jgi:predicted glycoside hydrolase/deacetylase ChbG (UPF0249 family)
MTFMPDSERAAELALAHDMVAGLHLNFSQPFGDRTAPTRLTVRQMRICNFMNAHKYAFLVYNPAIRSDILYSYQAQADEFFRLYGKPPSHVDGHHHKHLCSNVLLDPVIPVGQKLRRNFHFWPGEKGGINRAYRGLTDRWLARRYRLTDYFFALSPCLQGDRLSKVLDLARTHSVEVMVHPVNPRERDHLMSEAFVSQLARLECGTYSTL